MKKLIFPWWLVVLILLTAGMTVVGALMHEEFLWGLGLGFLLFVIMMIPVMIMRSRRLGRYDETKLLGSWHYSQEETTQVAWDIIDWQRKRNRWLAPFTSGCLGVMGGIFVAVLHEQFPAVPLWQWLWLLLPTGMPWVIRGIYFWFLKRTILKDPCETKIGRDFLLWGNFRPVLNERETLTVVDADFLEENGHSYLSVMYRSTGRMRYGGKVTYRDRLPILVPAGCQEKAKALVSLIRKENTPVKKKQT